MDISSGNLFYLSLGSIEESSVYDRVENDRTKVHFKPS